MHWIYAHLIGDYILQNDFMALNKKKSWKHCAWHVLIYMFPFFLCDISWLAFSLIAIQHYIVDKTGFVKWFMEIKGSKEFANGILAPWSIIVMDNIIHILWIALVVWLF